VEWWSLEIFVTVSPETINNGFDFGGASSCFFCGPGLFWLRIDGRDCSCKLSPVSDIIITLTSETISQ